VGGACNVNVNKKETARKSRSPILRMALETLWVGLDWIMVQNVDG
jgi:hypothetical protein